MVTKSPLCSSLGLTDGMAAAAFHAPVVGVARMKMALLSKIH